MRKKWIGGGRMDARNSRRNVGYAERLENKHDDNEKLFSVRFS